MTLVESVLAGQRLALSRLLSQIENNRPEGRAALKELSPHTGKAHLIGVTGAPGTGKSSLVNQIARYYRRGRGEDLQRSVAIVAVDPSSPFTGGAILGDRIRMRDLSGDPGVFIRSMASRGSLGGLAAATAGLVQAFDAAGYEVILIETVGAGQAEVDIARLAHSTLVVEAPGLGDDIQAIKAGILEIADVLVINKADRPGVENTERALKGMLELAHPGRRVFRSQGRHLVLPEQEDHPQQDNAFWLPPIQRTVSTEGTGIADLVGMIEKHKNHLVESGDWQRRERARLLTEMEYHLHQSLFSRWQAGISSQLYQETLEQVFKRQLAPQEAAERLVSSPSGTTP
jgi:LAO/AO transport system kinase